MALLKRITAATLMETLVATVLIIIVFMVSSFTLNNLFSNTIKNNTQGIENYLNELEYFSRNGKINIPFHDYYSGWEIKIDEELGRIKTIIIKADNRNFSKGIERKFYATN